MNLAEPTIKFLAKTICGDNGLMPRKKGPELMDFFSEYGHDDRKRGDFTNRLRFAESKLKLSNNTPILAKIIEGSVNLREFFASKINRAETVDKINEQLEKDGYKLFKINEHYKLAHVDGTLVEAKQNLSYLFIDEQIEKCHKSIDEGQFDLAMEQAKIMLVMVMTALLENFDGQPVEGEKSVEELYKQVKNKLKLNIVKPETLPFGLVQILLGFESIIEGVSRLTNSTDVKFAPKKPWAGLTVNSSKALAEFLVDYRENLK